MRAVSRFALAALALLSVLTVIVAFNTLRLGGEPLAEAPPPPATDAAAVQRLVGAIHIPTISTDAAPPSAESLAQFHALLERSFPRLHDELRREAIGGGSLLYTWTGTDPSAPALLLIAHQDVVPVEQAQWTRPPFSGARADGLVWGRGTLDDKGSLMAILEAAERLLARGFRPKQTIYLAFGHDEERGGTGAEAMAAVLKERQANIGLALDEGYAVLDGVIAGVRPPIAMIGIAEKGYVSVELTASGPGGHSSMPSADNAAVRIAQAVDRIAGRPMPARLGGPTGAMLDGIAPYADTFLRIGLANRWLTGSVIRRLFLANPETAAAIHTTSAPTIIAAGTKDNVLPQTARAVVNHRILPGDTIASVIEHDRRAIDDPRVRIRALPTPHNPGRPVSTASPEYRQVAAAIRTVFPEAAIVPGLVIGATDGRHYEGVARGVLRFAPFTLRKSDLERIHGNDERVRIADYMRAIAFYERLISEQLPS